MKKLVKKVLSVVLACAIMAVSLFTASVNVTVEAVGEDGTVDLLEFGDYLTEAGSTSRYYDSVLADDGETGADWDNAIIIDSAEEFVYLSKYSGDDTAGKYYKVADGIAGFNLSSSDLDLDGTLADNLDIITGSGKNHAGGTPGFQGHFDGNGATVYGAWTNHTEGNVSPYAGLFSCVKGEVTIKNVNVNKAYFVGKSAAGGIVGYCAEDTMCTVTIENCSVTDSYLETQGTGWATGVGAILGFGASAPSFIDENDTDGDGDTTERIYVNNIYNIKNCYVNLDADNIVSAATDGTEATEERVCHGGIAGGLGTNALAVSDCVVIGIKPYATSESTVYNDVQHSGLASHFTNVYTTSDVAITDVTLGGYSLPTQDFTGKIFALTDTQLKGAAAVENMDLDWTVWMADATGYPELRVSHKDISVVSNQDGTHSEICACGFGGMAVDCNYVNGVCAKCGFAVTCSTRKTIYWDGTVATVFASGTGTKDDPYIIDSASQLAYVVGQSQINYAVTDGKYFKVADGIKSIVLQDESKAADIMALDSAAAVKSYFESGTDFLEWKHYGWEGSTFCGDLDFNGVTIYGLYIKDSTNNAALISNVDAGAAIHNVALKNSYLTSAASNYQVGGIAGNTNGTGYAKQATGAIWFDGCVVANNYMYNSSTSGDRTGVIIGGSSDVIYMDNCLVYGNDATYGDGVVAAIWSCANNFTIVSDSFVAPDGLTLVDDDNGESPRYYNMVRNSIIFGADPYDISQQAGSRFNDPKCFVNVLTDAASGEVTFTNSYGGTTNVTFKEDQIKTVTLADLATAELGDAWINTDSYPELRAFHIGLTAVDNGDGTHSYGCGCNLESASLAHVYQLADGEHGCTVCGFVCDGEYEQIEAVAPTCTEEGSICYEKCNACGLMIADSAIVTDADIVVAATGHSYDENGICLTCDYNPAITYITYEIVDNAVTITDCDTATTGGITIPSEIDGCPVTAIGANAFQSCTKITKVVIPEGVTTIGNYSFNSCTALTSVIIPDSVTTIGEHAFDNCDALVNVTLPDGLKTISGYTFKYCDALTDIVIPDGVIIIGEGAFEGCSKLSNVTIPASVKQIYFGAFASCTNIDKVYITDLNAWLNITFDSGGVLIPDYGVANPLAQGAELYLNDTLVTDLVIPEGITKINTFAFMGCTSITSVTIPESVTTIGECAFYGCDNLTQIIYNGNATGWSNVTIGTYNDPILLADVTYLGCEEHVWEDYEVITEGDCTTDRVVTQRCTECHQTQTVTTTATGHTSGEAVTENEVAATCTESGSYESVIYCTVCGEEISRETVTVEATGHTAGEAVEENKVEATCTENGSYESVVYCTVCGEEFSRTTETIIALGHDFVRIAANDATCTEDGNIAYNECVVCYIMVNLDGDEITAEDVVIKATGHTYETSFDSVNHWSECSSCGDKINETAHEITDTVTDGGTLSSCACGYSMFTANASDEDNNVSVNTGGGAFPSGTEILFDLIDELHEHFEAIKEILSEISEKYVAYDITPSNPLNDGAEAEISFAIPEDFGNDVSIYYVDEKTGKHEKLHTQVRGGRAYAKTNHFSTYALIDETQEIDETTPVFTVGADSVVVTGTTVTVTVSVNNNPGIISMYLNLGYDANVFELVSAEGTDFTSVEFSPIATNPFVINWTDPLAPNNTDNGVVATLTFNVKEGATIGNTVITIDYDAESVFNENLENVEFATQNATVKVVDYLVGDANTDGLVDVKDMAIMMRYINGWDVTVDERAADVNADGLINNKDYVILTQYLNDWDVELKYLY